MSPKDEMGKTLFVIEKQRHLTHGQRVQERGRLVTSGQAACGLLDILCKTILQMRILRPREVERLDKVTQLVSGKVQICPQVVCYSSLTGRVF